MRTPGGNACAGDATPAPRGDHDTCYASLKAHDASLDGILFACVKTTRIYCRPVCSARLPLSHNVEFRASAAAAEAAGFRACLVCHPERAPRHHAGGGADDGLARALALLESDCDPAARLAYDDDSLDALFVHALGAPLAAVRQQQRTLFARQLLRETGLAETTIARAAGFTSAADLTRAIRTSARETPRALRARRRAKVPPGDDVITVQLGYRPPFDWDGFLQFHAARAIPGVETIRGRRYLRVLRFAHGSGLLSVAPGKHHALAVTVHHAPATALRGLLARVRDAFDLDLQPTRVAALLGDDPLLVPLIKARPGLRVAGSVDPFEQAVRAILGQQISVGAARKLAARLCARWGEAVSFAAAPELHYSFPAPQALATADIASLGMPGARGRAISRLAQATLDDAYLFARYRRLEDGIDALKALPGIGDWSAHYIAMRALREADAFPASDIGLLRACADPTGRRPSARALSQRAEAWRPLRAYAAQYLWSADAAVATHDA